MLPQILAQAFDRIFHCLYGAPHCQNDDFSLGRVFVNSKHDVLGCFCALENCDFFVAHEFDSVEERLTEGTVRESVGKILRKISILYLQFFPFLDSGHDSLGRHGLILVSIGRRFNFLDERCSLGFLFLRLLPLVVEQQHLAEPDAFDDAFGDDAHLLPLQSVIQQEDIRLLQVEGIHLPQLRDRDTAVVLNDLGEIGPAVSDIPQLVVARH